MLTPQMKFATLAYGLMIAGFACRRKNPRRHIALMATAVAMDLGLVLALQIQRDAIATALSFRLAPLQQAHIAASTLATLLYFPVILLGIRKIRSQQPSPTARFWHKRLGIAAFVFRSAGFLLMFSMLKIHT